MVNQPISPQPTGSIDVQRKGATLTEPPKSIDVEVMVWSANVLPTDHPGSAGPASFNDPHKYRFCQYLYASTAVRSVTIVCPSPTADSESGSSGNGVQVSRLHVPMRNLAWSALFFNFRLAWHVLRSPWHVNYFYDDGKAIPFILPLLLARIRGFPVVLDYRNPPIVHAWTGFLRPRRLLALIAERLACKAADLVVVLSKPCAQIVSGSFGRSSLVVPTTASPLFRRTPSVVLGERGLIRFAYWGSLDQSRGLEELVLGFMEACTRDPKTPRELLLIGEGDDKVRLEEIAQSTTRGRIRFLPWLPLESLLEVLAQASVSVVAIPGSKEQYTASYPLKFAEALALGRPVLVSDIPSLTVVSEMQIGVTVNHEKHGYAEGFLRFTTATLPTFVANMRKHHGWVDMHLPEASFAPIQEWLARVDKPPASAE